LQRIAVVAFCYTRSSVVGLSVCVSVCLLVTFMSPAKMAEPIEMQLGGGADSCRPKASLLVDLLYGDQGQTNPFDAEKGDKAAIRPFRQNSLTTCYYYYYFVQRKR